jgi:membrane fusion protein (multidrug efflux system)
MTRARTSYLVAKTLAVVLSAATVACATAEAAPKPKTEPAPVAVTTTRADVREMPKSLLITGSLSANERALVASDGAGKVVKTFVERGDRVKKGAVLARLDVSDAALAAAEASASAKAARAQEDHAKLERERADRLYAKKVISEAERDRMQASSDTSVANANAAGARAARASKQVADGIIRAPFDGVVVERFISVGEYVSPGSRVVELVQKDPMRLDLDVPESMALRLKEGDQVRFSVLPVPGKEFSATVRFLGPVLDRKSRHRHVEAVVDDRDARLVPGMFATTRLTLTTRKIVAIPENAISGDAASPRAFVVEDGRIEERVLQLGERDRGFVSVLKGISVGESVVERPSSELADGRRVQ